MTHFLSCRLAGAALSRDVFSQHLVEDLGISSCSVCTIVDNLTYGWNTQKWSLWLKTEIVLPKLSERTCILRAAAAAMVSVNRKISAASARSHTRRKKQFTSFFSNLTGILTKLVIILLVGILACSYKAIKPPPPKICGLSDGPPVTSPRIKLKDGRNISYIEIGIPKEKAMYKVIFLHAMGSCKHHTFPISEEVVHKYAIYLLSIDRPGFGESDPNPNISVKSTAQDIEEIADQLELGPKFFVIGLSTGAQLVWGCLKYIPHRLAGAGLLAPTSNYWWPNFPCNISKDAFKRHLVEDQWVYRVAHYAPWLTYWWNTQKLFPSSSLIAERAEVLSDQDKKIILPMLQEILHFKELAIQQGVFQSLHGDLNMWFSNWEFDPMDLNTPFPNKEGSVHVWHGAEDLILPVSLSRYIAQKLPWIQYHELPNAGHMFPWADGMGDSIVKSLVTGDQ